MCCTLLNTTLHTCTAYYILHTPYCILCIQHATSWIAILHSAYYILCVTHSSAEWKRVPNSEKKRMGFTVEDDGEFWYTIIY